MAENYRVKDLEIKLKGSADELSNSFSKIQKTLIDTNKSLDFFKSKISFSAKEIDNLKKMVDQLNSKLHSVTTKKDSFDFITRLDTKRLEKADEMLQRIVATTKELKNESKGSAIKVGKITVDTNLEEKETTKSSKSLASMISDFNIIKSFGQNLYNTFTNLNDKFQHSNEYVENFNLFSVAFKEGTEKALQFHNSLEKIAGVDIAQSLRYGGEVKNLADSLGLATRESDLLSENITKLVYDISSLYNISMKSSHNKLMSGLIGQTKPLRSLGIDVTQQTLQPYLADLGINEQVKSLTQAQKVMLRYIAILHQSKNAQGDFARTINNPANQMRILNETIAQATRWFQTLGIQILGSTLPPLIAFASAVGEVFKFLAKLFGFNIKDFKFVGVNTVAETYDMADALESVGSGASGVSDNLGKAREKAQELRKELLGFDRINNLNSPQDTSTGSIGGVGGGSGVKGLGENLEITKKLQDAMKGYDNLLGSVENKATKIKDDFMKALGFTKEINKSTGELEYSLTKLTPLNAVIGGFISYKTVQGFLNLKNGLHGVLDKFVQTDEKTNIFKKSLTFLTTTTFGKFIGGTALVAAAIGLIYGAYKLIEWSKWNNELNLFNGVSKETEKSLKPLIDQMDKLREISFKISLGNGFVDETVINTHLTQLQSIINKYEEMRQKVIQVEKDKITAQIESGAIEKSLGEQKIKALDQLYGYEKVQMTTLLNEVQKRLEEAKDNGGFISEEDKLFIEQKYEEINRLDLEMWEKMGNSRDTFKKKYPNYIGGIIEETDMQHIQKATATIKTETDTLFRSMENSMIDSLDKKSATYEKEKEEIRKHFEIAQGLVDTGNQQINTIYSKAYEEQRELTKDEYAQIQAILENSEKSIFELLDLSEEEKLKLRENFSRVTTNQNKKWSDEVLKTIKEQYRKELAELDSKYTEINNKITTNNEEIHELERDFLEGNLDETKKARLEELKNLNGHHYEELKELEEQKGKVEKKQQDKLRAIELEHEEHLKRIKLHHDEMAKQTYEELKKSGKFNEEQLVILKNSLTRNASDTKTSFRTALSGLTGVVAEKVGQAQNYLDNNKLKIKFDVSKAIIGVGSEALKMGMRIQQYHTGGFPSFGDMFIANERGAELVGQIGNRTAVVNQQQIVESVSKGVAEAVSSVLTRNRGSKTPINVTVKIGNKTIEDTVVEGLESALSKGYIPSI